MAEVEAVMLGEWKQPWERWEPALIIDYAASAASAKAPLMMVQVQVQRSVAVPCGVIPRTPVGQAPIYAKPPDYRQVLEHCIGGSGKRTSTPTLRCQAFGERMK
ncbi:hypothetical protein TcWFU_005560 [Taenia crassiceps]|uniref:Uncharacterized protein n=1 Tax=Taenia crassiceps TaxID=6207 RepID=A0ABR4QBD0_9CEST